MIFPVKDSDDAIGIVYDCRGCQLSALQRLNPHTFSAATNPTTNPHARVQVEVPRVTSLHVDVESEGVGLGVDFIGLSRVVQLLQGIPRSDTPSFVSDRDVCGRVVMCLEEVAGVEVGGEVRSDELFVLSAGLGHSGQHCSATGRAWDLPRQCLCPNDHSSDLR